MVRNSVTKRTPSRSPRKRKTGPAPKKDRGGDWLKAGWHYGYVRCISGEEFIGKTKVIKDGVVIIDPTLVTFMSQTIVLAPYGKCMKESSVFIPAHAILHVNEASERVAYLYEQTLKNTAPYVQQQYDVILEASIKVVEKDLLADVSDPSDEDLRAIEQEVKRDTRTKSQRIEELVKLAEAKGKGKNAG